MTQSAQLSSSPNATTSFPQGQVLKGRYIQAYRSVKGKLKGLFLQGEDADYQIKLPKYLRPMLVRELEQDTFVQVWAYPDGDIWCAINILPMSEAEIVQLRRQWDDGSLPRQASHGSTQTANTSAVSPKLCIQVCRKGKCYKQGSNHIWRALQTELEANPDLHHISIEATGCMKACKKGPNLMVLPKGRMLSRVTPEQALTLLSEADNSTRM